MTTPPPEDPKTVDVVADAMERAIARYWDVSFEGNPYDSHSHATRAAISSLRSLGWISGEEAHALNTRWSIMNEEKIAARDAALARAEEAERKMVECFGTVDWPTTPALTLMKNRQRDLLARAEKAEAMHKAILEVDWAEERAREALLVAAQAEVALLREALDEIAGSIPYSHNEDEGGPHDRDIIKEINAVARRALANGGERPHA